ncbi:MAG: replicative DNA helicase [Planctomycetota bacterium]|nr:MAG: replicative DNA helicase [Planctomycetota bacterium]
MGQDALRDRIPYDIEAEKCVLGSVLRDPQCAADVVAELTRDDFYLPRHRELYALIEALELRSAGACDPITVAHESERLGTGEALGGRGYLEELMAAVPTLAFLDNHLRIVRDLSIRRQLLNATEQIQRLTLDGRDEIGQLLDQAEQSVLQVGDRLVQKQVSSARDLVTAHLDSILTSQGGPQGLRTGFLDLDELHGFRPGDFVVLAARPSMGKTALALNVLSRIAVSSEKAVLLFSLEMPADQILLRLLSAQSKVRHDALRRGMLDRSERQRLTVAAGELSRARIYVDDSSQPSLAEIRAKARRLRHDHNLDLIVLDYLQLLSVPRAESRQQEIAVISRSLKGLARDLEVPVFALAQLNRAAEKRDSHRPMLSDLRESGAIEQDSDLVMLLFREDYYSPTPENAGVTDVIVAKNRHGPTGNVQLRFASDLMRFENLLKEPAF